MNNCGKLNVRFVDSILIGQVGFRDSDGMNAVEFGEYRIVDTYEHYSGAYEVEPSAHNEVVLETKNKAMDDNVTVRKIYAAEVSNPAGGNTYYIASSLDE